MTAKTLKTLEYDKVLSLVSDCAVLKGTKQRLLSLTPFTDIESAQKALDTTEEAYKLLYDYGVSGVDFFDEPGDELERAEKGASLSLAELLRSARLLKATRIIRNSFTSISDESIVLIPAIAFNLYCDQYLEKEILSKVLSDDKIADNASDRLFALRRKIKQLNEQIREKLNYYVRAGDKYLQENIVTMRGDRYVIPVKSEYRSRIKGFVHDQSATGSTVFIEPVEVLELNNQLRVTTIEEANEVEEIVRDLSHKVGMIAERLIYNAECIRDIDEYLARAIYAYKTKSQKPVLNVKGVINVNRGRHPLIDAKKVVPIDVRLGKDYNYLLITGPNTGGKTVTLKLVGLFALMATSGLFLPCSESKISLFDEIFCDVGDEQSIEQSLSTFSSHVKNLVDITNNVNERSLVLIDEIGAGTDPDEGSALAQAVIEKLLDSKSFGIVTTHYSKLKEYAYVKEGIINASMDFDNETFAPVYKLNIGVPGTSNAIEIASRLGLGKDVTKRAVSLLSDTKISFENVLREAEKTRKTAENERKELVESLNKAKEELEIIEKEKLKLAEEKQRLYAQAKAESRRIINEKVEEADELVDKIKEIFDKEEISGGDIITARTLRNKLEEKKYEGGEDETAPLSLVPCDDTVKVGDKVFVKSMNAYAVVSSVNSKKGECFVAIGNMRLGAKLSDLFKNAKAEKTKKVPQKPSVKISVEPTGSFTGEIKLIGQRREEAIDNVENFLDQAVLAGAKNLRIVHGKGRKILRQAVFEVLKRTKSVESFRLGKYGEGEDGVTIVTLK